MSYFRLTKYTIDYFFALARFLAGGPRADKDGLDDDADTLAGPERDAADEELDEDDAADAFLLFCLPVFFVPLELDCHATSHLVCMLKPGSLSFCKRTSVLISFTTACGIQHFLRTVQSAGAAFS
jgi:hypothetical protein